MFGNLTVGPGGLLGVFELSSWLDVPASGRKLGCWMLTSLISECCSSEGWKSCGCDESEFIASYGDISCNWGILPENEVSIGQGNSLVAVFPSGWNVRLDPVLPGGWKDSVVPDGWKVWESPILPDGWKVCWGDALPDGCTISG